jgi:hypothetical protein
VGELAALGQWLARLAAAAGAAQRGAEIDQRARVLELRA